MSELMLVDMCKCFWKLPEIKNLLEMFPETDIHYNNDLPFITACKNDNIPIVKFLIEQTQKNDKFYYRNMDFMVIETALSIAITYNKFVMFKYLEAYMMTIIDDDQIIWDNIILEGYTNKNLCLNNHLPLLKYLYEHKDTGIKYCTHPDYDIILETILKSACINGYKEVIKWIIEVNNLHIISCSQFKIKMDKNKYEFLRITFNNTYYTDIQEIIYTNSLPINPVDIEYLFKWCCISTYGHITIAQKLFDLATINNINLDITKNNHSLFKNICKANKVAIAKWIYSITNISLDVIRADNDALFCSFAGKKNHCIGEWFITLCDKYQILEDEYSSNYIECIVYE